VARIVFVFLVFVASIGVVVAEALLFSNDKSDFNFDKISVTGSGVVIASKVGMPAVAKKDAIEDVVLADDARGMLLRNYLEKYKSPLLPYADIMVQLSDTYGYDYRWIVAIAQQESNLCKKIPVDSHNCWGYGIHSAGTLRFDDYDLALKNFAQYLKDEYFDLGLDTPELMMSKYCPHSNGSWAFGIRQFFDEIEAGKV